MLTGAVGALAGVAAATLAGAQRVLAAGDDGSTITVGSTFLDVRTTTYLSDAANNNTVFSAVSSSANGSGAGIGLFGSSSLGHGVEGHSDSGAGVVGFTSSGYGVYGISDSSVALRGSSGSGYGVYGISESSDALRGISGSGYGVNGESYATDQPASVGTSHGNSTGVLGHSGFGAPPASPAKTGVYGYAAQDAGSVGVRGTAPAGRGGIFKGGAAQLKLSPSAAASHPASGQKGDLFVDTSGRLWFCKGGTTWKQLA